jgi:isoquinoline 1-oxidoreductase alpha subunit
MSTLNINGRPMTVDVPDDTPVLWALRDELGMTGTKFGCGAGLCGSCTVHVDGQAVRSCITPVGSAVGKKITTIEAMEHDKIGAALQSAWIEQGVPQCGYCQCGQIMAAASLLKRNANPSDAEIDQAMSGNICRCGTYNRIHAAIKKVAQTLGGKA